MLTPPPLVPQARSLPLAQKATQPALSAMEVVFDQLLQDIVSGRYPARTRLPAERDLAKQLGASRPTLREALRQLAEWNLVRARRGSGISVCNREDWMIEAFPSFVRYGQSTENKGAMASMVANLLQLRRALMREIMGLIADRVPPVGTHKARIASHEAWHQRDDMVAFARADMRILRILVESADFLPGLWLLNRMSGLDADLAGSVHGVAHAPKNYLSTWGHVLDAIDRRNSNAAVEFMNQCLLHRDERLVALLASSA